jgi:hypothetical protein
MYVNGMGKTMDVKALEPEALLRTLEAAFFEHLDGLRLPYGPLEGRIRERMEACERKAAHLVRNAMDRGNVGFTVLAVAAFEVLREHLSLARAREVVDACLNAPMRAWVLEGTRAMLDGAGDAFGALVAASKEREASYFGPSFTFERPVDDGHGYVLNVKRCLFHEVLKACGCTELQPVLCRADLNWIDAIDPARHHLRFERPSTFASADVCRMWFMRVEHLEAEDGA